MNSRTCRFRLATSLLLLSVALSRPASAAELPLDDFESADNVTRWRFYDGHEFPGARGEWDRRADAAHGGQWGGRLGFDFTGGGNYVAAYRALTNAPESAAVRLWVKKPRGNRLKLRYVDQTGQTLQKGFFAPDEVWADVAVSFTGWSGHWGGAQDGVVHGPPRELGFLIENDGALRGALLLDDLRLVPGQAGETTGLATGEYVAARFAPGEGWQLRAGGEAGESSFDGKKLHYDFRKGARWVAVVPREFSLPGTPREFRLRLKGRAPGHPVRLELGSHFVTFSRVLGYPDSDQETVLRVPAPPGQGWVAAGGENDGTLHGPLRVRGIYLDAAGKKTQGELELIDLAVTTAYPPDRACLLAASAREVEDRVEFRGRLRSLLAEPVAARLRWWILDWDGLVVEQGETPLTLPACGEPAEVTVPARPGGRAFLEAAFVAEVTNQVIPSAQACYVAAVEPRRHRGTEERDEVSPFGMGLYLYRYPNDVAGLRDMDRAAQLAQDIGVKWAREEFNWGWIEKRRGEYDWSFYDQVVATAKRHGITLCGLLAYWAGWTKPYTQEGIADYCRFAAAAASRYRADICYWEVWNEPNIFFWSGPKDLYAELLKQAYAAIKAANPDAMVLGCSTAGIDLKFIRRTIELGGTFDILSVHPYRGTLYDPSFVANLREASAAVGRPVWITEVGWGTHVPHNSLDEGFTPTSERRQAELLVRTYVNAIAAAAPSFVVRGSPDPALHVVRGFAANDGGVSRTRLPDPAQPPTEGLPPRSGDPAGAGSAGRRGQETRAEPQATRAEPTETLAELSGARIAWYDFRDDGTDPFYAEHNMGIIDREFRPKPAFRAYATMTRLLAGKPYAGPRDLGLNVTAYDFHNFRHRGADVVTALWCTSTNCVVQVPSLGVWTATTAMGESSRLEPQHGLVELPLRAGVPVFLVGPDRGR